MAKDKNSYDVFISYSRKDGNIAREIAKALTQRGVNVFYDESQINFGDSISDLKEEALEHSKSFLLLVSPDYLSSQWQNFELGVALSREPKGGRRIFPVILREVPRESMPIRLSDIVAINAKDHSIDEIASILSDTIKKEEITNPA